MSGYLPDGCTQEMVDDAMGANDPCPHKNVARCECASGSEHAAKECPFDASEASEWSCEDCGYSAFWNGARWVGSDERPEYDS
jgi:hypothetical protein